MDEFVDVLNKISNKRSMDTMVSHQFRMCIQKCMDSRAIYRYDDSINDSNLSNDSVDELKSLVNVLGVSIGQENILNLNFKAVHPQDEYLVCYCNLTASLQFISNITDGPISMFLSRKNMQIISAISILFLGFNTFYNSVMGMFKRIFRSTTTTGAEIQLYMLLSHVVKCLSFYFSWVTSKALNEFMLYLKDCTSAHEICSLYGRYLLYLLHVLFVPINPKLIEHFDCTPRLSIQLFDIFNIALCAFDAKKCDFTALYNEALCPRSCDDVEMSSSKRARQRNPGEIRPLSFKLGGPNLSIGSSFVGLGNTKVKCHVNTPKPPTKKTNLDIGQLVLEVRNTCGSFSSRIEEHFRATLLEALERHVLLKKYPRQIIEAWVTIEEDDGGVFNAALMGLSLAFVDCGIQLYDIISSCSVVCWLIWKIKFSMQLVTAMEVTF
ncbi:bifunctional PNPase-RNase PH domain superfamily/Ribosomal protein S5 domain 2-type fold/Exoribonuclease [Babesia duncani]|uniref:Bifunctional PNPase-RNase PH domain superfamily/Ribosomal protein S5 domain 2-type fold/Exoribonuclease n=1 Tax=Babesia duncani TaxID=323732 RepID=A0AAD9UQQ7_9APIC|nr:bifunctional PNPase-RNase PH domain superfamily/Ribosomal protein S5 domain 2-type fold/Exoribonuclease [Babesia duncani]